jgi:hypothetical protein
MVAALSETWGVDSNPDGCTVSRQLVVEAEPATGVDRDIPAASIHDFALEMAKAAPGPI